MTQKDDAQVSKTEDTNATDLALISDEAVARMVKFFQLLDKWDKEASQDDRPGQD